MKVELRSFDDTGKTITVGTITEKDGELEGDTGLAKRVLQEHLFDQDRRQYLTADNGQAFLELLHTTINGSRLWATKAQ